MRNPTFQSSEGLVLHDETWRGSWACVSATTGGSADIRLHPPEGLRAPPSPVPTGSPFSTSVDVLPMRHTHVFLCCWAPLGLRLLSSSDKFGS